MAGSKLGYYTRDSGQHVYHYFMGDEPPLKQYILNGDVWQPLVDGWSLMDMVINAQPDLDGPVVNPPRGVPACTKLGRKLTMSMRLVRRQKELLPPAAG